MTILQVSFSQILEQQSFPALMAEYEAECSIPEIGPINPQEMTYAALEKTGVMHCFGAFADGQLIGFATMLATVMPHYGKKVATLESIFVAQAHRASGAGKELMNLIESFAKVNDCVGILYSAPVDGQLERVLSASKKYRRTNSVFYRSLA